MKFLVPNYSCLQNSWLVGLPPSDPRSLCPLSSTEFVESRRTKFLVTPLLETCFQCHCVYHGSHMTCYVIELDSPRWTKFQNLISNLRMSVCDFLINYCIRWLLLSSNMQRFIIRWTVVFVLEMLRPPLNNWKFFELRVQTTITYKCRLSFLVVSLTLWRQNYFFF